MSSFFFHRFHSFFFYLLFIFFFFNIFRYSRWIWAMLNVRSALFFFARWFVLSQFIYCDYWTKIGVRTFCKESILAGPRLFFHINKTHSISVNSCTLKSDLIHGVSFVIFSRLFRCYFFYVFTFARERNSSRKWSSLWNYHFFLA